MWHKCQKISIELSVDSFIWCFTKTPINQLTYELWRLDGRNSMRLRLHRINRHGKNSKCGMLIFIWPIEIGCQFSPNVFVVISRKSECWSKSHFKPMVISSIEILNYAPYTIESERKNNLMNLCAITFIVTQLKIDKKKIRELKKENTLTKKKNTEWTKWIQKSNDIEQDVVLKSDLI